MPFTPFHLGPGALFKAIGGERFSFTVFGGSQVLMDIEPLVRIIRGDEVLHGFSHSIAGAFVVAMASTALGRPAGNLVLRQTRLSDRQTGWNVALISALVGTYSHIGLDAVMHADMNPIWPFASGNTLLALVSVATLQMCCVGSGLLGGLGIWLRTLHKT